MALRSAYASETNVEESKPKRRSASRAEAFRQKFGGDGDAFGRDRMAQARQNPSFDSDAGFAELRRSPRRFFGRNDGVLGSMNEQRARRSDRRALEPSISRIRSPRRKSARASCLEEDPPALVRSTSVILAQAA